MRYKSHFTRLFMPTDKTIITMSTHKNCDVRFFEVSNIWNQGREISSLEYLTLLVLNPIQLLESFVDEVYIILI